MFFYLETQKQIGAFLLLYIRFDGRLLWPFYKCNIKRILDYPKLKRLYENGCTIPPNVRAQLTCNNIKRPLLLQSQNNQSHSSSFPVGPAKLFT